MLTTTLLQYFSLSNYHKCIYSVEAQICFTSIESYRVLLHTALYDSMGIAHEVSNKEYRAEVSHSSTIAYLILKRINVYV